jgi:hypothetical protein
VAVQALGRKLLQTCCFGLHVEMDRTHEVAASSPASSMKPPRNGRFSRWNERMATSGARLLDVLRCTGKRSSFGTGGSRRHRRQQIVGRSLASRGAGPVCRPRSRARASAHERPRSGVDVRHPVRGSACVRKVASSPSARAVAAPSAAARPRPVRIRRTAGAVVIPTSPRGAAATKSLTTHRATGSRAGGEEARPDLSAQGRDCEGGG